MALRPLSGANPAGLRKAKPLPFSPNAKGFADVFDFSSGTTVSKSYQVIDLGIGAVASLYIDNTNNSQFVTFNVNGVDFSCSAYSSCIVPFLVGDSGFTFVGFSNGGLPVSIMFINVILPAYSLPSYVSSSQNIADTVTVSNPLSMPVPVHILASDEPFTVAPAGGSFSVKPDANNDPFAIVPYQGYFPVTAYGGSLPVSGTFWQATQPVSLAATVNVNVQNMTLSTIAQPSGNSGAQATALGLTAATTPKTGSGRLWGFSVTSTGTAMGTISDGAAIIGIIPMTLGYVTFPGGVPFSTGLTVTPGTGQTVSVFYA